VRAGRVGNQSSRPFADEQFAEALHGMSQPLTTLECGLELAIRHDTTLAQARHRLKALQEAAQILHQRLLELRMLQRASALVDRGSLARSHKSPAT